MTQLEFYEMIEGSIHYRIFQIIISTLLLIATNTTLYVVYKIQEHLTSTQLGFVVSFLVFVIIYSLYSIIMDIKRLEMLERIKPLDPKKDKVLILSMIRHWK